MKFLQPNNLRQIRLYENKIDRKDLPHFSWSPHEHEEYGVKGRKIGPIWYTSNIDFGGKIIWSREHMWTNQADAALIVDSCYDFLEGFQYHQWVWFKDGVAFHPPDIRISKKPTYQNLDHAVESMAKNIGIPADLLRYVIVNSTLTTEEKRSIGFDRPDFTEYKF